MRYKKKIPAPLLILAIIAMLIAAIITIPVQANAGGDEQMIIDELAQSHKAAKTDRPMKDDVNLNAIQKAFDKSKVRDNVFYYKYDDNITYKLRLREYMTTTVVLPKGEIIKGYLLGDKKNFTIKPMSSEINAANIFGVYGRFHGADTNLTVFGDSGNIYSFYMRNDSVESKYLPTLIAYIQDETVFFKQKDKELAEQKESEKKKSANAGKEEETQTGEYIRKIPAKFDPMEFNAGYRVTCGDKKLAPKMTYDDGYFTYFRYHAKNLDQVRRLPAIYRVVDGYDVPVNTRVKGGTIIAETVNDKWCLRSGEAFCCIWSKDAKPEATKRDQKNHDER